MHFTKVQATGNDFILIEAGRLRRDWSQMAKTMCERCYGVGADGLILLLSSRTADFRMRVFMPDGSEVATYGNAIRCLARYLFETGLISEKVVELSIETLSGIKKVELKKTRGKLNAVKVNMGRPAPVPGTIKTDSGEKAEEQLYITSSRTSVLVDNTTLTMNLVSVENPFAVWFTDGPVADCPLEKIGVGIEHTPSLPEKTCFEVAQIVSPGLIAARVWECGNGEKCSSYSGACAAAVSAQLQGYVGQEVEVKLPAGTYTVEWDGNEEIYLTAPAEIAFTGEWPE